MNDAAIEKMLEDLEEFAAPRGGPAPPLELQWAHEIAEELREVARSRGEALPLEVERHSDAFLAQVGRNPLFDELRVMLAGDELEKDEYMQWLGEVLALADGDSL